MRISDWSSDVCSSDLGHTHNVLPASVKIGGTVRSFDIAVQDRIEERMRQMIRSEEHTSELQSLMRISYAVFCLKKKKQENVINKHKLIQNKQYTVKQNINKTI